MATPQGNMIAYQPLKPTELKVGDIYAKHIDQLIKQGEAAKAAELKRKQMEGKALADILKGIKIEPKTTIAPFQNQFNKVTNDAINFINEAQLKAEDINIPIEERRMYAQRAKTYASDIMELATFMADPNLVKAYQNNLELINSGKAFKGDPRIGLFASADAGLIDIRRDNNGNIEVGYIEDLNDTPDKKMVYRPLSEVKQLYMTPVQSSEVEDFKKYLFDTAQKVTKENMNSNGYVKTYSKVFDKEKARENLLTSFGYDPNQIDEDFNINSIPNRLNQFFYQKAKRNINSKEDFLNAIDDAVDYMRTNADEKTFREVLKTPEQILGQRLDNEGKVLRNEKYRQDIAKGNQSNNETSYIPTLDNGNNKVKIIDKSGKVLGIQEWNMNTVSLPPQKNMIKSDNTFGLSTFKNKAGKTINKWTVGAPASDGNYVYAPVSETDFNTYITKRGYNPMLVKKQLIEKERYINNYSSRMIKGSIYENVKINPKAKDVNSGKDSSSYPDFVK